MVTHPALVVLAITMIACTPSRPPRARVIDTPESQEVLAKLKGYTSCLDEHSARVFEIADDYARRLGGREPTPDTRVFLHASPDPQDCVEAIDEAQALPPASPALERAGAAFARAIEAVHALTKDARDRFDPRSAAYDPAKGVASYGPLIAAFREFDRAQGALFDEVRRLDLEVRRGQLARVEQAVGRTIVVLVDLMLLRGEELIALAATPPDQLERLDVKAAATQLAAFEDALAEAVARARAEPSEMQAHVKRFNVLADRARMLVSATRQLIQRASDELAFTDAERITIAVGDERTVVGTPAAMVAAYNKLVESYYARNSGS